MNILEEIIAYKKTEIALQKEKAPVSLLENMPLFERQTYSLKKNILNSSTNGIIAEYKRKSPSKGIINKHSTVEEVTAAYCNHGASGISILTDNNYFGGSLKDLTGARFNNIPILRKEFIIDEYQIVEAKANGADVILLIAACLSINEVEHFSSFAKQLGLEVILEIHDELELNYISTNIDLVGINNRNLKTFIVDLSHSIQLADKIGDSFLKISESGIRSVEDIIFLKGHGFNGFLIGENFMKEENPSTAFVNFSKQLHSLCR